MTARRIRGRRPKRLELKDRILPIYLNRIPASPARFQTVRMRFGAPRSVSEETRRLGSVPEAPGSFQDRHPGISGVRELMKGIGKEAQSSGFAPRAPGPVFSCPAGLQEARERDSGLREAHSGAGFLRGTLST